jgi:hypothetical protein
MQTRRVFRSSAQLHGLREGKMALFSAGGYKELLASRPSPKSLNAPREEEILMMDFASPTQALAKVARQDQHYCVRGLSHLSPD